MSVFVYKTYSPKAFSPARVRALVLNELKRQGQRAVGFLKPTVEYWNNKPGFTSEVRYKGGNPFVYAYPIGDAEAVSHWVWLNEGTMVRYATMTYPFQSKTVAGGYGNNRPGVGGKKYVDRKVPHAGIEARKWGTIIQRKMQADFTNKINQAVSKGLSHK